MTRPGVWLQNITTQEPDDQQLEVAIEALKESLKLEPATAEPLPAPLSWGVSRKAAKIAKVLLVFFASLRETFIGEDLC